MSPFDERVGLLDLSLKVGRYGGVLEECSVAEANRRHVASRPRRIAGKQLGLVFLDEARKHGESRGSGGFVRISVEACGIAEAKAKSVLEDLLAEGASD